MEIHGYMDWLRTLVFRKRPCKLNEQGTCKTKYYNHPMLHVAFKIVNVLVLLLFGESDLHLLAML